jgi:hypothetical protein
MARLLKSYDRLNIRYAKEWAKENGFEGAQGGHIYRTHPGDKPGPVCQGYSEFFRRFYWDIMNGLTRSFSAFKTFDELLRAPGGYRPTIHANQNWRKAFLASEYNRVQRERGDERRAFVPEWPEGFSSFLQYTDIPKPVRRA